MVFSALRRNMAPQMSETHRLHLRIGCVSDHARKPRVFDIAQVYEASQTTVDAPPGAKHLGGV